MRPVRLVMEGFGAFKARTEIDFDDTDFFALVGATGSGKSTVVDALCFALYGSVPRYGDERLVGSAMSMGHVETRVQLTFEAGGQRYHAARVVRRDRKGRATTKEARLEAADGTVLAGRATEMAGAVERVLGLPFAHFTRCVVLPQGEFARFLHDRPADRQELLVTLLELGVYERVAQEANRQAATFDTTVRLAEQQLAGLAAATPEAVDAAWRDAQLLAGVVDQLEAAGPRLAELDRRLADSSAAVLALAGLVEALAAVRVPADVTSRAAALAEARQRLEAAEAEQAVAAEALEAAEKAVAALPPLDGLLVARDCHADLATALEQLGQARRRQASAAEALEAAAAAEERAVAVAADAEADHEHARQRFAAHVLAEHVEVGADCPVCGQEVRHEIVVEAPTDLTECRQRLDRARQALDEERQRHRQAEVAAERAATTVADSQARVKVLQDRLADHPERAALDVLLATVEDAREAEQRARQHDRERAAATHRHRQEVEQVRASLAAVSAAYHAQRDALRALSPPPPGDDVLAAWAELEAWAAGQRRGRVAELAAAQAAVAEVEVARATELATLREVVEPFGLVAAADDLGSLHRAAVRAHAAAAERASALERDCATAAALAAQRDEALDQRAVAGELGRLLSARGFERWLVAEALHRLAAGASDVLLQLSRGQFSLVIDDAGEFAVVDHANGDDVRPVRTLSGGETFQASLALALALADELSGLAAGGAAKLDAIFLDEGFGSLDADSLDTVAATIEALGTGGRMVGIVTHVRELAARVPVRYEVTKGPATSTVERVVA